MSKEALSFLVCHIIDLILTISKVIRTISALYYSTWSWRDLNEIKLSSLSCMELGDLGPILGRLEHHPAPWILPVICPPFFDFGLLANHSRVSGRNLCSHLLRRLCGRIIHNISIHILFGHNIFS